MTDIEISNTSPRALEMGFGGLTSDQLDLPDNRINLDLLSGPVSSDNEEYGDKVKAMAQSLHTEVYLREGFIDADDINTDGLYVDPYTERSTYLVTESQTHRSACRYIHANRKDGLLSLPTTKYFSIDSEVLKQAAGVKSITDLSYKNIIEISGLVSVKHNNKSAEKTNDSSDATRQLYASIIRDSVNNGYKLWVLNVDQRLLGSLGALSGKEQLHILGPESEYIGPATKPVAINPFEVIRAAFADDTKLGKMKRGYLAQALNGVSSKYLPDDIKDSLDEYEIPYQDYSRIKRLMSDKKTLAYAAIMGYSSARVLPANGVDEFNGSVPLLWGIDVATAVPYTWGLIETITGKTLGRKAAGAAVASSSFMAPYAYFWLQGEKYPPLVGAAIGGFVGIAAVSGLAKVINDKKLERGLFSTDL